MLVAVRLGVGALGFAVRTGVGRTFRSAVVILLTGALATSGCGYSLAGRGSFLPATIRIVGIPQLENQTTFFNIEQALTEKLRTEFIGRGKFRVLSDAQGADAVLTGTVTSINVQPVGFTDQQLASRYLFTMNMKVEFTEAGTRRILWSNDAFVFRETYDLTTRVNSVGDTATFFDQERSSLDRITSDVARSVVTSIVEAF